MISTQGSTMARRTLGYLRHKIVSGEWPMDTPIPKEPELMELIGVGKSTVREAVRTLANLGMLETVRGVGTFVRSRSPIGAVLTDIMEDYGLQEILRYRRALEIEAAQLAAAHRSEEQLAALEREYHTPGHASDGYLPGNFHHRVFDAANSPLLADMYTTVMDALRAAIHHGDIIFGPDADRRQHDHSDILAAIRRQDIAAAGRAMTLHVDRDLVAVDMDEDALFPTPRARQLLAEPRPVAITTTLDQEIPR